MNTHLTDDALHRYVDGELDPATSEACARHFTTCEACAERLATLEDLLSRVESMPAGITPPEDLWPGLQRHIESSKVVALDAPSPSPSPPPPPVRAVSPRRPWWTRPGPAVAAAATLILATASATAWLLTHDGRGVQSSAAAIYASLPENTPPQVAMLITDYEGMTQRLAEQFASKRGLLPPAAVVVVEENLRVIDEALGELREVLLNDPENETVLELLATAYRQKVAVLEHATESIS